VCLASGRASCELWPGEQPAIRLAEALEVSAGEGLTVPDHVAALLAHHEANARLLLVIDQRGGKRITRFPSAVTCDMVSDL
jgi:hypothetical protein